MEIVDVKRESCPAARLIGKSYAQGPDWGQWWSNGWFGKLEALRSLEFNGDAYIGAVHIVDGAPEYWIGRLFPAGTRAPGGLRVCGHRAPGIRRMLSKGQRGQRQVLYHGHPQYVP